MDGGSAPDATLGTALEVAPRSGDDIHPNVGASAGEAAVPDPDSGPVGGLRPRLPRVYTEMRIKTRTGTQIETRIEGRTEAEP